MNIIIDLIIFVLGFVAGGLVFRNNARKGEAVVQLAKAEAKEAIDKMKK